MIPVEEHKARMRAEARARRALASSEAGDAAGEAVRENFMAALGDRVVPGLAVSAYWPMGEELDIRPLLTALDRAGCVCALPVVGPRGTPLAFRRWREGQALHAAGFGTSEPGPEAAPVTPALLLVPLLAFDAAGHRLGYGAAYYDLTLKALRAREPVTAVGVAFEAQRVDAVPFEAHDETLDWVITEVAAHRCVPAAPSDERTA